MGRFNYGLICWKRHLHIIIRLINYLNMGIPLISLIKLQDLPHWRSFLKNDQRNNSQIFKPILNPLIHLQLGNTSTQKSNAYSDLDILMNLQILYFHSHPILPKLNSPNKSSPTYRKSFCTRLKSTIHFPLTLSANTVHPIITKGHNIPFVS